MYQICMKESVISATYEWYKNTYRGYSMEFISRVRKDFRYFHECEARVKISMEIQCI